MTYNFFMNADKKSYSVRIRCQMTSNDVKQEGHVVMKTFVDRLSY